MDTISVAISTPDNDIPGSTVYELNPDSRSIVEEPTPGEGNLMITTDGTKITGVTRKGAIDIFDPLQASKDLLKFASSIFRR